MKATAKKNKKASAKKTVKKAAKRLKPAKVMKSKTGQKSSTKRAKKAEPAEAHSLFMNTEVDQAHSPGHKKMNLKRTDKVGLMQTKNATAKKPSVVNRRVITGAAVGKTGRIVEV